MVSYSVYSDCGDRKVNEDAVGVFQSEKGFCFVLCDGLGGHGMGDVASSLVVDQVGKSFNEAEELEGFGEKRVDNIYRGF